MKILIVCAFIVLLVSCWKRNDLPSDIDTDLLLVNEPRQTVIYESPFKVDAGGLSYEVQPVYEYDIYGLLVSYKHHNSKFGLHNRWGDHINVADFCVVWGNNVKTAQLNKLDFWNGQFTCNVKTSDSAAWKSFNMSQLSNNHLITTSDLVRDTLNDVNIGDQIRVRGKLVNYKYPQGGQRKTSTTRTDKGNGACETIYVEHVDILHSYTSLWRNIMYAALVVLLVSLGIYLFSPVKPS